MTISEKDQRTLFARSGNRCAYPDCRKILVAVSGGQPVLLGEAAHIIARSPGGPRGSASLSAEQRDSYENLVLLCNVHHQLVDAQPTKYTVEVLKRFKADLEAAVDSGRLLPGDDPSSWRAPQVRDTLFSNLLPVVQLPGTVYSTPVTEDSGSAVRARLAPPAAGDSVPFVIRAAQLYAFHDLTDPGSPFAQVVTKPVEVHDARAWWSQPDKQRWYVELLNHAISPLTYRHGLRFDPEHKRYFFAPIRVGDSREVEYRTLTGRRSKRKAVWRPSRKSTGEARPYWLHHAVSLRFMLVDRQRWVLSIRPGLRVTVDGEQPPPSDLIGRRVTRRMNRLYNYELLTEIQFWRDYLGDSKPQIVVRLGSQRLVISTELLDATVEWPGIPEEHDRAFTNVRYEQDLWSWSELQEALAVEGDAALLAGEEEDDET